ncbi:MAG: EI24 domain-containing protein [Bacteroidia bacterium]
METFLSGFSQYWEALWLLKRPNILRYLAISTTITLVIAFVLLGGAAFFIYDMVRDIYEIAKGQEKKFLSIIWEILPVVAYILVIWASFKSIVILANGFVFTQLSAEVEAELTRKPVSGSGKSLHFELIRAVKIAIWSIFKEMLYTLPLFLLGFIPVVGIVFVGLAFAIQAYFVGAGYWDFILERKGHDVKESIVLVNKHRYLVTGNGFGFVLLMFVPVVGLILAPPLAVISATSAYLEAEGKSKG